MARRVRAADNTSVIGYVRVSTEEQAESRGGLDAQRAAIEAEVDRKGWRLVEMVEDAGYSAKNLDRPGMVRALGMLRAGAAGGLVVAKLDRATRSTIDAASLIQTAQKQGWTLCALDLNVDTSTATGELVASLMAAVSQWERKAIADRTRAALAVKKAQGVRLGRPPALDPAIGDRIVALVREGKGWSAIARELDDDQVPTAHGATRWQPATVRAIAHRLMRA